MPRHVQLYDTTRGKANGRRPVARPAIGPRSRLGTRLPDDHAGTSGALPSGHVASRASVGQQGANPLAPLRLRRIIVLRPPWRPANCPLRRRPRRKPSRRGVGNGTPEHLDALDGRDCCAVAGRRLDVRIERSSPCARRRRTRLLATDLRRLGEGRLARARGPLSKTSLAPIVGGDARDPALCSGAACFSHRFGCTDGRGNRH